MADAFRDLDDGEICTDLLIVNEAIRWVRIAKTGISGMPVLELGHPSGNRPRRTQQTTNIIASEFAKFVRMKDLRHYLGDPNMSQARTLAWRCASRLRDAESLWSRLV